MATEIDSEITRDILRNRVLYRWRPVLSGHQLYLFEELGKVQAHFIDLIPELSHNDNGVRTMYIYFRSIILSALVRVNIVDVITQRLHVIQNEMWSDKNTYIWLKERVDTQLAMLYVFTDNYIHSGKTDDDFVSLYSSILDLFD
jgi:hypothetical protein